MSLANKQTFNLISSLIIGQVMPIYNNVFINKLVSFILIINKLHFNYIYIYETINFFFFIFPPSIQNLFYEFLLQVLLPKKEEDEVLLLPTFRFSNTNTIITYIQTAGACACVFLFGGELEGLPRVNHKIYENLGLKFLTNILRPSQRIIPVIIGCSGVGREPIPHPLIYICYILSSIKKVIFFLYLIYYYYYSLIYIVYVKAYKK